MNEHPLLPLPESNIDVLTIGEIDFIDYRNIFLVKTIKVSKVLLVLDQHT